jgi:hypothetical protein
MKFVVVSHDSYRKTNGGLMALMTLAKKLRERGYDSRLYLTNKDGYENNDYFPYYHEGTSVDDDTVVIYIDIPVGNLLNAKRVVRYITYGSHWYPEYSANEIVYYHAPFCKNNPATKILSMSYIDPSVRHLGLPRLHRACYAVKKGVRLPSVRKALENPTILRQMAATYIDHDRSQEEIVRIFNTTKYFFCYDPCTFFIIMSLICGCVVIQHPLDGYTEDEWRYTIGIGDIPGIAYGYENLAKAEAGIRRAPEKCFEFLRKTDTTVDAFIRDMETGNYTYEPCYRFSDSPYALQHVYK